MEETLSTEDRAVRAARRREKRRLRHERAEWWSTKLHALLWVVAAIATFIGSDFFGACTTSKELNSVPFYLGAGLFFLVVLGVLRMAFWFPKEGDADFEKAHPKFTMATTFGGVFSFIFLTIGLWPVYRIFAPFMLILYWFGMIMSLHFVP